MKKFNSAGYSLIEVIVVVAIFATLLALAIPAYRRFNSHQELKNIASGVKDQIRAMQNKAINGVVPTNSLRSKWFMRLQPNLTFADNFITGACDTTVVDDCATKSGFDFKTTKLPDRFRIRPIAIAPETATRYSGVSQAVMLFSLIDGSMTAYNSNGNCLEAVVNGVCTSQTMTLVISSYDYNTSCWYIHVNAQGNITEEEKACS